MKSSFAHLLIVVASCLTLASAAAEQNVIPPCQKCGADATGKDPCEWSEYYGSQLLYQESFSKPLVSISSDDARLSAKFEVNELPAITLTNKTPADKAANDDDDKEIQIKGPKDVIMGMFAKDVNVKGHYWLVPSDTTCTIESYPEDTPYDSIKTVRSWMHH